MDLPSRNEPDAIFVSRSKLGKHRADSYTCAMIGKDPNKLEIVSRSRFCRRKFVLFVAVAICLGSGNALLGQRPSSPRNRLGVDEVTLTTGKRMYGIVLDRNRDGELALVVERAWFQKTYPAIYREYLEKEIEANKNGISMLLRRLKKWKSDRSADENLIEFIDEEIARISKLAEEKKSPKDVDNRFLVVRFLPQEIKEVFVQPPERRRIVGCAWKHELDRATIRTTASLERELKKKGIDVALETFDLSDQIASAKTQTETEWNARVAIFEFVLRQKLEFQGTGTTLIRADANQAGNGADLVKQLLSGGLSLDGLNGDFGGLDQAGLLGELLGALNANPAQAQKRSETGWWKKATEEAARDGFRGVKITRVKQSFGSSVAQVEILFLALMTDGQWKPVATFSATANRDQQSAEDIERIKSDPQVQKILGVVQGLGLGGNENILDLAMRQGAATEKAMQLCNREFLEFVDRYTAKIDAPPLLVK